MEDKNKIKSPFTIAIIDLIDAYHYADIFDDENRYTILRSGDAIYTNYEMVVQLADRLFWAFNPDAKTQKDWIKWEAGYDVQIYDAKYQCVYKAHEKLPEN